MSSATVRTIANPTPMMRQYLETKAKFPDAILFFRLGDFYEMFFDDAVEAAEILDIQLTSRGREDERIPMCGIPHHAAKGYVARLVEAGRKVALCEQIAEETGKGGRKLFRREVVRIVTPGMVLDEDLLDPRAANYLCTVSHVDGRYGLALLDVSTGEFRVAEVGSEGAMLDEIRKAAPREVIVGPEVAEETIRRSWVEGSIRAGSVPEDFDPQRAERALCKQFQVRSLDGFGLTTQRAAIAAAGAALAYVGETQRGNEASHLDRVQLFFPEGHLILDDATRTNLELVRTLHGGKKRGSLLGVLDKTATAMGGRELSRWISSPLLDLDEIARRHDGVEELLGKVVLREEVAGLLREVGDLERILGRLSLGMGNARDARALGLSLGKLSPLADRLGGCDAAILSGLAPQMRGLEELASDLERALEEDLPPTTREGQMFRKGWDADLDELIELSVSGKEYLARLEARERERTGIASLKVRYNRVFGYYLEVTKANLHLVPEGYLRKQTTANAERFTTDELQTYEAKVLTAEERRIERESELFEELRRRILDRSADIKRAAAAIAQADALVSLARVASDHGYVRPTVDAGDTIEIVDGRHPVVELALQGEPFVPNDVTLDRTNQQLVVITGPNMAGKSTILRQTALITLMAQAGSFVPAARARIGLVDRIFCRVGASDNLAKGQSTFMVEMVETASILHGATERSLVVLDEIGRGTSTFDGLSIAWAVAEHLHDRVGARTLFATHYHELVELARERPRVKNATVAVTEQAGRVIFLRKLVDGGASRSYGIEVAKLAGVPQEVVVRAREILTNLEKNELDPEGRAVFAGKGRDRRAGAGEAGGAGGAGRAGGSARSSGAGAFAGQQLGLFGPPAPPPLDEAQREVLALLEAADPNDLSPRQALDLLFRCKERLPGKGG